MNILLLEAALLLRDKRTIAAALLLPAGLLALAVTASPWTAPDLGFLTRFRGTLGASPLFLTLLATAAFYLVAWVRGLPAAWVGFSLALIMFSCCGCDTFNADTAAGPFGLPIIVAGVLYFTRGLWHRHAIACLLGGLCMVTGLWIELRSTFFAAYHGVIPVHLLLAVMLAVGAVFRDAYGRMIQALGAATLLLLALGATWHQPTEFRDLPESLVTLYPPLTAIIAVGYGLLVKNRWCFASTLGSLCGWLPAVGLTSYRQARNAIVGLDYILSAAAFFLVAIVVSMSKLGLLQRLLSRRRKEK